MTVRDFPFVETRAHGQAPPDGRRGTAYVNPRDAYSGVPILAQPTWGHEIAAYFYLGGISSGAFVLGALALFHHMLRIFNPSPPMNRGPGTLRVQGALVTPSAARMRAGDDRLPP